MIHTLALNCNLHVYRQPTDAQVQVHSLVYIYITNYSSSKRLNFTIIESYHNIVNLSLRSCYKYCHTELYVFRKTYLFLDPLTTKLGKRRLQVNRMWVSLSSMDVIPRELVCKHCSYSAVAKNSSLLGYDAV